MNVDEVAEQVKSAIVNEVSHDVLKLAIQGDEDAAEEVKGVIGRLLRNMRVGSDDELVNDVFARNWGLGVIQHLYDDPEVNEIWVNGPRMDVWVERNGRRLKAEGVFFETDEAIQEIQLRLLKDNQELNQSVTSVESRRLDGSRVTMTVPPETTYRTITIRKHKAIELTTERLIQFGTLNMPVVELIKRLIQGRANILLIGPTSAGKTSALRWMTQFIHPSLRIGVLESSKELFLEQYLPGRNIISFEEQLHLGRTLLKQFHTMLRLSPDIIILGEVRGAEADQLIKVFRRGHPGSMGTIHSNSPEAALQDLVDMIMEDGRPWNQKQLYMRVARSVDVIIQLHVEPGTGTRRFWRVTEVICGETDDEVTFRDLVRFENGDWVFPNPLSDYLEEKLRLWWLEGGEKDVGSGRDGNHLSIGGSGRISLAGILGD
jgi:pilus assembly protein CpaF